MTGAGQIYWSVIDPIWDLVSIYGTPELFLHQFSKLSDAQRNLFAAHWCQSEVRNGGFHQFFSNSTGVLAPEAAAGFRAIGLPECADLVVEAMKHFEVPYPRKQEERAGKLEPDSDPFEIIDDRFFDAMRNEGFEKAADAYASKSSLA